MPPPPPCTSPSPPPPPPPPPTKTFALLVSGCIAPFASHPGVVPTTASTPPFGALQQPQHTTCSAVHVLCANDVPRLRGVPRQCLAPQGLSVPRARAPARTFALANCFFKSSFSFCRWASRPSTKTARAVVPMRPSDAPPPHPLLACPALRPIGRVHGAGDTRARMSHTHTHALTSQPRAQAWGAVWGRVWLCTPPPPKLSDTEALCQPPPPPQKLLVGSASASPASPTGALGTRAPVSPGRTSVSPGRASVTPGRAPEQPTGTMTVSPAHQRYGVIHGGCPGALGLGTGQPRLRTSGLQSPPVRGPVPTQPNPPKLLLLPVGLDTGLDGLQKKPFHPRHVGLPFTFHPQDISTRMADACDTPPTGTILQSTAPRSPKRARPRERRTSQPVELRLQCRIGRHQLLNLQLLAIDTNLRL